ncbi:MAG TPA: archease [bacterium]
MTPSATNKKYVRLDHTGDIRVKVFGNSLQELFENSAYALFDTITDASSISAQIAETVEVSGIDKEELLVNWLAELNYLFLTESKIFNKFEIEHLSEHEIIATAIGEKFNSYKHPMHTEIKAVTFHDLQIEKKDKHWETKIVFDI